MGGWMDGWMSGWMIHPSVFTLPFLLDGYGVEDVQYVWTFGPSESIKIAPDMTLSQFDLIGFPHGNDTLRQMHRG